MLSKEQLEQFREAASERMGGGMLKSEQRQLLEHVQYLELQLRAANTFLQAETERADANEQDKRRIDFLEEWGGQWDRSSMSLYVCDVFYDNGGLRSAIDDAICAACAKIIAASPMVSKQLDLDALAAIGDLPCGAACDTIQPLSTKE